VDYGHKRSVPNESCSNLRHVPDPVANDSAVTLGIAVLLSNLLSTIRGQPILSCFGLNRIGRNRASQTVIRDPRAIVTGGQDSTKRPAP